MLISVLALWACSALWACGNRDHAPVPASTAGAEPRPVAPVEAPREPTAAPAPAPAASTAATLTRAAREAGFKTEDEHNTVEVFRLVVPSTVFVTQKKLVRDYWAGTAMEVPAGSGSGFIWDAQGHIVTNYHVIKGAQGLTVTLHDHKTYAAEIVGEEKRKDIAVLKLKGAPGDLIPIKLRPKGSKLDVGQKAIAIGNPFGLDQTLTTGIISALGREVKGIGGVTIRDMVQTDAAINPGNSGGPLLDSAGRLIGMNTMIFSRSGASAGIGFAVPASAIQRVVPQIIRTGHAEQVGLGVHIDPAQRLERRLRLKGIVVLRVLPGTPAAAAGLRGIHQDEEGIHLGDVIIGINDQPVTDYDDLYNILDQYAAGTEVKVTVFRDGGKHTVTLKLILLP
jgi:S1-C subfamily serine protease